MTLYGRGDVIEMEDIHHRGEVVCPRVAFSLAAFTEAILIPAKKFDQLATSLRAILAERRAAAGAALSAELKDRFETVEGNLPADWAEQVTECTAWLGRLNAGSPPQAGPPSHFTT